jgi:hypothetical protein
MKIFKLFYYHSHVQSVYLFTVYVQFIKYKYFRYVQSKSAFCNIE